MGRDLIYISDINSPSGLLDGEGARSISSFIVISNSFEERSPIDVCFQTRYTLRNPVLKRQKGQLEKLLLLCIKGSVLSCCLLLVGLLHFQWRI